MKGFCPIDSIVEVCLSIVRFLCVVEECLPSQIPPIVKVMISVYVCHH